MDIFFSEPAKNPSPAFVIPASINLNETLTPVGLTPTVKHRFDPGDTGFVLTSSILLWIMIPGCGLFYSGMATTKSSLSLLLLSLWSVAVTGVQWWAIGYSLSFSNTASPFVGNFDKAFLMGVYDQPFQDLDKIPELVFCLYQGITAGLGPSLILGVVAERGRILPAVLFILIWTTFVYDFIASWSLNPNGWSLKMGVLDFGGGSPVHVPSGAAAMAYAVLLGPRSQADQTARPHNMQSLFIGTTLIWFGSFGYNAGSAFAASMAAIMSCFLANLSGSAGAITWAILDYRTEKRLTGFGFCAGAVVGLVVILPGSGYIPPYAAVIFGVTASLGSYWALQVKNWLKMDDTLDVFVMHGVSGVIGNILTGIFADKFYGGQNVGEGGWVNGHWMQVVYQLVDTAAAFAWSFIVSFVALFIMNKIPCLKLRVSPAEEEEGIDETEMGIKCYEFVQGECRSGCEPIAVIEGMHGNQHENNGNGRMDELMNKNNWF